MKQIPIDLLFKYNQEPLYIVNLTLSYEELLEKFQFEYEVWQEDGLGDLIGASQGSICLIASDKSGQSKIHISKVE